MYFNINIYSRSYFIYNLLLLFIVKCGKINTVYYIIENWSGYMKLKTFRGGIHPNDQKFRTNSVPVTPLAPPEEIIIPLRQHIGAPCEPLVNIGDRVLMGQKIGDSDAFVSAPVHSSVSGTVVDIKPHPHTSGTDVMSIFIQNDFKDEQAPGIHPWNLDFSPESINTYVDALKPEDIVSKIREAGITGMGGASFPLHVKLSPPKDCVIDTILVNGAECEPYLTSDHREMLEKPYHITAGVLMIAKAVGAKRILIAIESNKPDAIELMKKITAEYPSIEIAELKTKYPQGSEKQLIQAVTKKQVPSGGLPSAVGLVVCNVTTCAAVARAVVMNMPLIKRIVTVSGDAVAKPANFSVRFGVKYSYLFEACGGFCAEPGKIVSGGPMMGIAQASEEVTVTKGTSGVLAFTTPPTYGKEESVCIKCSKCVDVCPMRLMPNALSIFSEHKNADKLTEYHVLDCMECGSCTYICPQRRFIVQHIKLGKTLVNKQVAKKG